MCRISGIIGSDTVTLKKDIEVMTDAMRRGGPDDLGIYIDNANRVALGHRRLSILDLSTLGSQPFLDSLEKYAIVFNGEIYNYIQLKNELVFKGHEFRSNSDTEVILYGYIEWGIKKLLSRLEGMFAFIIYDKVNRTVVGARDQIGIKPLYYSFVRGTLYFSSEVRGLKAMMPSWPENENWHVWFLSFGFIPEPHTTLKNVFHLPSGSFLEYSLDNKKYQIESYYNLSYNVIPMSSTYAISRTRELVTNAVSSHLLSDAPLGVFLSGGLDSSILATLAQANYSGEFQKIKTLSIYFEDEKYSELKYQNLIRDRTGVEHHSFKVTENLYQSEFENIVQAYDQPSIDGINTYFISKYAKELGLKVALSGLGADELFGGYSSFRNQHLTNKKLARLITLYSKISNNYPEKKFSFYRNNIRYKDYLLNRGLFIPSDVAKITGFSEGQVIDILNTLELSSGYNSLHPLNKISFLEFSVYMKNQLLRDSDYMSMWHGLEIRVPFLDKSVVDFTLSIPPELKFVKNKSKFLVVEAFKRDLPREIWDRPKKGFSFPLDNWVNNNSYLQNEYLVPKYWQKLYRGNKINFAKLFSIFLKSSFYGDLNADVEIDKGSISNLFVYLSATSSVGGIQKVNLNFMRALKVSETSSNRTSVISVYDKFVDSFYTNKLYFKGFNTNKLAFISHLFFCEMPEDNVIIGHVNLLPILIIFKCRKPKIKVKLIVHGIEVWNNKGFIYKILMKTLDEVISVSEFTKRKVTEIYGLKPENVIVVSNSLSSTFNINDNFESPQYLIERYNLKNKKIIFLLSRISELDRYKGYLNVIKAISEIRFDIPNILFLIGGKTEESELNFINLLIDDLNLNDHVKIIGFLEEEEVIDHYKLADVFVMPSEKEGFGIGFIEAAALGVSVIAGNQDGSKEALLNGEIGVLVDPNDIPQLVCEIKYAIQNGLDKKQLQNKVLENYSFSNYLNLVKSKILLLD